MRRALVFIDIDAVIRNFIHSGAFKELESRYEVTYVFHADPTSKKQTLNQNPFELGLERVEMFELPRKRMGMWWWLVTINALHLQKGKLNYESRRNHVLNFIGNNRIKVVDFLALPIIHNIFKSLFILYMGVYRNLDEYIKRKSPDIIIHPSVLGGCFMNDLLLISRKRKIPFILLMNSWDNPSAKAVSSGFPDKLVVWGEHSKKLAIEYMDMPENRIEALGAAQFELYKTPLQSGESEIRKEFSVPENKKIIVYAGAGGGHRETVYLRMIESLIESESFSNLHVIYRPHPWRGPLGKEEEDFLNIDWKHITMDPSMVDCYESRIHSDSRMMFMADYHVMKRLLNLASAIVSPLSTVLLESILNGKPALMFYPLSEQTNDHNLGLVHFHEFIEKSSVLTCLNEDQFLARFRELIAQTENPAMSEVLMEESRYFVSDTGRSYGSALADLIDQQISS